MRLKLAILAAAAALAAGGSALACSCVLFNSAAEQLAGADVAFRGRVLDTRVSPTGDAVTRFAVVETLKGRAARTVRVAHHTESATCGLRYKRGATVFVLANAAQGGLRTGLCSQARFPLEDFRKAARGEPVPTLPAQY